MALALCGLRLSVESYVCLRYHCNVSAASALDTRSVAANTHLFPSRVGTPTSPVDIVPGGNSLSAVAEGETTQQTALSV